MPTIMPEGENLRRAVKWISGQISEGSKDSMGKLIAEASTQFDLKPLEEQFLFQEFKKTNQTK